MKKSLLSIGLLAAMLTSPVAAEVTRDAGNRASVPERAAEWQGAYVNPVLLSRMSHKTATNVDSQFSLVEKNVAPRRVKSRNKQAAPARESSLKGTEFKGFRTWPVLGSDSPGWYQFNASGSTMLWSKPSGMTTPYGGGFQRNGQLYLFAYAATTSGITDSGMYLMDEATGEAIGTLTFDLFDGVDKVVNRAVYDPDGDVAYVVTYNSSGESYILQKFDPVNYTFTDLGVTVPSDWLAFAWSPVDKTVYMLDESCILKKYDSKSKKFVTALSFDYDNDTYTTAMAYSPKDNAFLALIPTWDSSDEEVIDAVLLGLDGTMTKVGTPGDEQWVMLECSDTYVEAGAPAAPVISAINIADPALSGSLEIQLPSALESGDAISGTVYLETSLDGTVISPTLSGAAGSKVTLSVSATEGLHRYVLTAYILTDSGKKYGTPAVLDHYFGNDVPDAPTNVSVSSSKITWSAVTKGAHGGYVNASDITYNVYLDGEKLNGSPVTETTYSVSISGASSAGHIAEVEAVCGDKVSDRGVSDKYYGRGAMNLPVSISPDATTGDMDDSMISLFSMQRDPLNTEELRGWRYDDQSEHTGGFYCLCPKAMSGSVSDEWLFLPVINFPDKDKLYRYTMDVWTGNHVFTEPETYEVTLTKNATSEGAIVIREAETVDKKASFETSETVFGVPEAGEWYIGIHYISPIDSYRLYTRNYRVEEANASGDAPAAVTELSAEAAAKGELKANLTFKMPTLSVSGSALSADDLITATAVSDGGEASITGAPGQQIELSVATVQGDNTIHVTTSSEGGLGLQAEVNVYTGVYAPGTPYLTQVVSDDNCTLTINVDVPEYNEYHQYAGTAGNVVIYRKVSDEWRAYENIGESRSWTYEVPDKTVQDLYQFGVATFNAAGYCETMATFGVHLGKLYTIPMSEVYSVDSNDNIVMRYEPVTIEHLSYLPGSWGFCDPTDVDEDAANSTGVALYATWESDTQMYLPRFSTKDYHNVKADFDIYFGDKSPTFVSIYASSPSNELTLVDQYQPSDGSGWEHKLVTLPSWCQNQGWVQLVVRCNIDGYSQYFLMDSYSIDNYPEEMFTITGIEGNSRAVVGEATEIKVEVQNAGTQDAALPSYTFRLIGDNGVIGNLTASDAPATVKAGYKEKLSFLYTPKDADRGDVLARFTLNGQPSQSVSEAEKEIEVLNAALPVVYDLSAEISEESSDVTLRWSAAQSMESFEAADEWSYGENIRGFRNIDRDGNNVWAISEVSSYPGRFLAKAYQVFDYDGISNPLLAPHTGDQYLIGMSSTSGKTDDWLISPEVKGGTEVSFWLDVLDPQYSETIYLMYSKSGNDVNDFVQVSGAEATPEERGWQQYSYTLPSEAKYFAIWHNGFDGANQFGVRLDDIAFEAANPVAVMDGYNLYRDGSLLASGLQTVSYVDAGVDISAPVQYVVRTTGIVNGERVESDRSNVVWVSQSGVSGVATVDKSIRTSRGEIIVAGHTGDALVISDAAGRVYVRGTVATELDSYSIPAGVYIVKCGANRAKVIVK